MRIPVKLPPRAVGRALLLGVPTGAALFGAAVAFLGGASLPLLVAFWCAGALVAGCRAWGTERWRLRAARQAAIQRPAPLPPVDPEEERRARRVLQERLVRQFYSQDRLGIPSLPPPSPGEAADAPAQAAEVASPAPSVGVDGHGSQALPLGSATTSSPGPRPGIGALPWTEDAADAPGPVSRAARKRGGGRRKAAPVNPPEAGERVAAALPPKKRRSSTRRRPSPSPEPPPASPAVVRAPGQPGSEVLSPEHAPAEAERIPEGMDQEPMDIRVIEGGQA